MENDFWSRIVFQALEVFAKHAVPRWDHDRHGAMRLRLASQPDQRLRLRSINVTKLLDLLSFTRRHVRQLFRATEHANPTRPTRSGTTLDGNRSFNPSRIDLTPIARAIFSGAPRQILYVVHSVCRAVVVFIVCNSPLLVHRAQKTKQSLTIVLRAFAQNLFGRLPRMLGIDQHLAGDRKSTRLNSSHGY